MTLTNILADLLRQVCPCLASDDTPNAAVGDAILRGERPNVTAQSGAVAVARSDDGIAPNVEHVSVCQPRVSVECPWSRLGVIAPAPLGDHVAHVVGMTANGQVTRVDAARRIASVQDVHSVWNWAVVKFPDESVRVNVAYATVSGARNTSRPQDAIFTSAHNSFEYNT
jgi:hypothetical protein